MEKNFNAKLHAHLKYSISPLLSFWSMMASSSVTWLVFIAHFILCLGTFSTRSVISSVDNDVSFSFASIIVLLTKFLSSTRSSFNSASAIPMLKLLFSFVVEVAVALNLSPVVCYVGIRGSFIISLNWSITTTLMLKI